MGSLFRPKLTWEEKRLLFATLGAAAPPIHLLLPFTPAISLKVLVVHIGSCLILIFPEFTVIAAVPRDPQGDAGPTAGAFVYLQGTRQVRI